jgi:hypothetical protein
MIGDDDAMRFVADRFDGSQSIQNFKDRDFGIENDHMRFILPDKLNTQKTIFHNFDRIEGIDAGQLFLEILPQGFISCDDQSDALGGEAI